MKHPRVIVGLFLLLSGMAGCGDDMRTRAGMEGGPCYPNGTCNLGLVCLSGTCVDPASLDAAVDGTVRPDAMLVDGANGDAETPDGALPDGSLSDGAVADALICVDLDQDGYGDGCPLGPDCDDQNAAANPAATESCDTAFDDDCDGSDNDVNATNCVTFYFDGDQDGYGIEGNAVCRCVAVAPHTASASGDCNDAEPSVHPGPGASEECGDGLDNDCNGYVDDEEPDQDQDGFGPCDLPLADCNDLDPLIGQASVEVPGDGIDNDCDGLVDNDDPDCDCQAAVPGETQASQMLKALGLCNAAVVVDATAIGNPVAYGAFESWGAVSPRSQASHPSVPGLPSSNCKFVVLSTGPARSADPQGDTTSSDLGIYNALDPAPASLQDGAEINDLIQLRIRLRVPFNATGFGFDFAFFSAEYPEYVCTEYSDTFYALVDGEPGLSGGQRTSVSFDISGREIGVNNGFMDNVIPPWSFDISGTGYEVADAYAEWTFMPEVGCTLPSYPAPKYRGTMTGWLRTTAPLTPGGQVDLTFSIHDEGDEILDSAVILDNFRWHTQAIPGPATVWN